MVNFCRLCALDQVGRDGINLFKSTIKSKMILNRLKKIAGIELKKKKGMPECICCSCQKRLEQAFEFRQSCRRAQTLLCSAHAQSRKLCIKTKNGFISASHDIELSKKHIISNTVEVTDESSELSVNFETVNTHTTGHSLQNKSIRTTVANNTIPMIQLINSDDEPPISDFEVEPIFPFIEESKDKLTIEDPYNTSNCKEEATEISFDVLSLNNVQPKVHNKEGIIFNQNNHKNDDYAVPKKRGRKKKCEVNLLSNDEKSAKFICELCGKSYSAQHYLLAHMNLHNGVNPYICEICSERFHSERNLKRHLMKHAGLKPYPCRHCDSRFLDYYARLRHERVHTNDRPAKCSYCDKAFTTNYILKNHLLTHTGERAFSCKICDRSFSQKKHLVTHYKSTFHKQNEEKTHEFVTAL